MSRGRVRPSRPPSVHSFSTLEAKSGAYLRDSSRFPRRRPFFNTADHHRVSPKFIRSRKCVPTALTAESSPTQKPVVLKVVPVKRVLPFQGSPRTRYCAPLFFRTHDRGTWCILSAATRLKISKLRNTPEESLHHHRHGAHPQERASLGVAHEDSLNGQHLDSHKFSPLFLQLLEHARAEVHLPHKEHTRN